VASLDRVLLELYYYFFFNLIPTINHCIGKTILSETLFIVRCFSAFKRQTNFLKTVNASITFLALKKYKKIVHVQKYRLDTICYRNVTQVEIIRPVCNLNFDKRNFTDKYPNVVERMFLKGFKC